MTAIATPAASQRRFAPRRGLPSGRALLGALLITLAFVATFAYANRAEPGPSTEYLVVVNDLEPGDSIALADVELVAIDLPPEVAAGAIPNTSGLEGATVLRHLRAGEILAARDLHGAAFVDGRPVTGVHELTIPVPRDRSPVSLRRGDRVTLLAYDPAERVVHTALEDAVVLTYNTDTAGIGSSDEGRLTLAVPDATTVAATTLHSYGPLTVVLTSRSIDDHYPRRFEHQAPPADSLDNSAERP